MQRRSRYITRVAVTVLSLIALLIPSASSFRDPVRAAVTRTPATTPLTIRIGPSAEYSTSGLMHWSGGTWLVARVSSFDGTVRPTIYKWSGSSWARQATLPGQGAGLPGGIVSANLTHSGAPDFVFGLTGGTSGSYWFSVLSRAGGHWHSIPIGYGSYLSKTQWGYPSVKHGLIRLVRPSCGCPGAGVASTKIWFGYRHGRLVPAAPPGPKADCSTRALDSATPITANRYAARFLEMGRINRAYRVSRFTCHDGWALARSSGSETKLGLFEQRGRGWLRTAVHSWRKLKQVFTAAPLAMVSAMARKISVLGARHRRIPNLQGSGSWPSRKEGRHGCAARSTGLGYVEIPVTPGGSLTTRSEGLDHSCASLKGQRCQSICRFQVATDSQDGAGGHRIVMRFFRLHATHWRLLTKVTATVRPPDGQYIWIKYLKGGGSGQTAYTLSSGQGLGWLMYFSKRSGRWGSLAFRSRFGSVNPIEAVSAEPGLVTGYPSPHVEAWYRQAAEVMKAYRYGRDPRCDARRMASLSRRRISRPVAACAYGWGIVEGVSRGRRVIANYSRSAQHWTLGVTYPRSQRLSPAPEPPWLLQTLLRHVRSKKQ